MSIIDRIPILEGKSAPLLTSAGISLAVVLITTAWLALRSFSFSTFSKRLKLRTAGRPDVPPGSLGLPMIGDSIAYLNNYGADKMPAFYAKREAKYGPIYKFGLLGHPTVILGPAPASNKFILTNEGKLMHGEWPKGTRLLLGPGAATMMTGVPHKAARSHFTKFFSMGALARTLPDLEAETLRFLESECDALCGGPPVSALELTRKFTFEVISRMAMGLEPGPNIERLDKLYHVWPSGIIALAINIPGFAFHKALKARGVIQSFVQEMIDKRKVELEGGRAKKDQDLLSFFLTEPGEDGSILSDENIKDRILEVIFAGFDTTSSVASMALWYMSVHSEWKAVLEKAELE